MCVLVSLFRPGTSHSPCHTPVRLGWWGTVTSYSQWNWDTEGRSLSPGHAGSRCWRAEQSWFLGLCIIRDLIKLLPLALSGEWVIFSAGAAQLMAILQRWPQWLLLYLLQEFWLRSVLGDDFIPNKQETQMPDAAWAWMFCFPYWICGGTETHFSNCSTLWSRNINPLQKCVVNLFLWCFPSPGRLCWGTGTAWQWLTLATWHSSPMTRWRPGCRNSFTNLAGERELGQQSPAGRFWLPPLIADRSSVSLSAGSVGTSGQLLSMESSCSLFVCCLFESCFETNYFKAVNFSCSGFWVSFHLEASAWILSSFFIILQSSPLNCLGVSWGKLLQIIVIPTNFNCCLDKARQRMPTCHLIFSVCSKLKFLLLCVFLVTFSDWAVPAWVSGPSATSLQMGTSSRQSPTTNLSSKHWLMASGKACKLTL